MVSAISGIITSVIAAFIWELRTRWKAHKSANVLIGDWEAYKTEGRNITEPMEGAGLTVVSFKSPWRAADSAVLSFWSEDVAEGTTKGREHKGTIVLDPRNPWLATRIHRYTDSNEISQQRLEINPDDPNIVYIFPDPTVATLGDVYGRHAWKRTGLVPLS